MEQFIEVHFEGAKQLINLRWVEEIHKNLDGGTTIYFAFSCPHSDEQDYIKVDESYSEILSKIWINFNFVIFRTFRIIFP